jgi:hypothetical protein
LRFDLLEKLACFGRFIWGKSQGRIEAQSGGKALASLEGFADRELAEAQVKPGLGALAGREFHCLEEFLQQGDGLVGLEVVVTGDGLFEQRGVLLGQSASCDPTTQHKKHEKQREGPEQSLHATKAFLCLRDRRRILGKPLCLSMTLQRLCQLYSRRRGEVLCPSCLCMSLQPL